MIRTINILMVSQVVIPKIELVTICDWFEKLKEEVYLRFQNGTLNKRVEI